MRGHGLGVGGCLKRIFVKDLSDEVMVVYVAPLDAEGKSSTTISVVCPSSRVGSLCRLRRQGQSW